MLVRCGKPGCRGRKSASHRGLPAGLPGLHRHTAEPFVSAGLVRVQSSRDLAGRVLSEQATQTLNVMADLPAIAMGAMYQAMQSIAH